MYTDTYLDQIIISLLTTFFSYLHHNFNVYFIINNEFV